MAKNEIMVTAIENGTVIDHIPAEKTYDVREIARCPTNSSPPRNYRVYPFLHPMWC